MPSLSDAQPNRSGSRPARWPVVVHSARTGVTAVSSLLAARLLHLPEAYWAPITTLVITQSSLGAALKVSWQRFVGTVMGAVIGGIVATYVGQHAIVFGVCVFILGILSDAVHSDQGAYRFGGVTLAIVLLVPRAGPAWQIAFHRFAEVTVGIVTALIFAVVWPEADDSGPASPVGTVPVFEEKTNPAP